MPLPVSWDNKQGFHQKEAYEVPHLLPGRVQEQRHGKTSMAAGRRSQVIERWTTLTSVLLKEKNSAVSVLGQIVWLRIYIHFAKNKDDVEYYKETMIWW